MKVINMLALLDFWISRIPVVLSLLVVWQGTVNAENRIINYDLNLGILFHDEPTFVHPTNPPTHPNGEIEDNYFSDTMRFAPITLSDTPGSNSARIVVNFVNSETRATQRLRLDAKGTGFPFPETFALRFPGEPSHATIGPGMFLTSSHGTIEGVGDGTLAVTLTGIARSTSDMAPPTNPYSVSFTCFIDNCTTDAHFPDGRDLTDAHVTFTGLVLDVTLDNFERCSANRPDCEGITFDGFGFSMLGGDIAIHEPDRVVALTFDLNDGTFNQRAGTAEDSYLSGPIPFDPVTLQSDANTLELQIRFRDSTRDTLQRLEIAALGTGAPTPETFASRLPGDPCFDDGLPSPGMPCEHSFGPGMVISNSSGFLGDAFTTMQTTVSLRGAGGTFANDFINPYVASSNPSLVNPVSLCGHSDDDECTSGPHFPDLVDGDNVASIHQLVVDLDFGSTVGSTVPITVDTFEFNMLAGSIESKFTFLPDLPFASIFPFITFESDKTVSYDATSDLFSVDAVPVDIRLSQATDPVPITPSSDQGKRIDINILVDETGSLISGVPGDDVVVVGEVDLGALGVFSGLLLTGEVTDFNYQNLAGSSDEFEILTTPTGGRLAFLYANQRVGISITSGNSTFAGDFTVDFYGEASGGLGNAMLNALPIAFAGADQTLECSATSGADVQLDGTVSFDPDGDPITFTWTGPFGSASGPTPEVTLPIGMHVVTLSVEDSDGGVASDTTEITVEDTTPPELSVSLAPAVLWPPNHKLIPITASITVVDQCDDVPTVRLISVTSNEPDNGLGDGDKPDDIQDASFGTDDREFQVRSERSGLGSGRTYTVTYEATDASSNVSVETAILSGPKNRR